MHVVSIIYLFSFIWKEYLCKVNFACCKYNLPCFVYLERVCEVNFFFLIAVGE